MREQGTPLRLLFLGCGEASRIHARALRGQPGVRRHYASRDAVRAEAFNRAVGGDGWFPGYEAGLADASMDAVVVATPTVTHLDLVLRALDAGRHVIVEKPAFMTSSDADAVGRAASIAGRSVMVAENYVYKPVAAMLRRAVVRGELGEVRFVLLNATKRQSAGGWRADPAVSGGGALFEGGIHWVSFAATIGLEVVDVTGYRVGREQGPERSSLLVFRYDNGAVGALAHSWELTAPLRGLRASKVQGTEGAVTFESNGFAAFQAGRKRRVWLPLRGDPLGHRAMYADFLRSVRSGAPPFFTLEMASRDLRLLEVASVGLGQSAS